MRTEKTNQQKEKYYKFKKEYDSIQEQINSKNNVTREEVQ